MAKGVKDIFVSVLSQDSCVWPTLQGPAISSKLSSSISEYWATWQEKINIDISSLSQVRLQTQSSTNPLYSGAADCVRQTVAKEGPRALYKGKRKGVWWWWWWWCWWWWWWWRWWLLLENTHYTHYFIFVFDSPVTTQPDSWLSTHCLGHGFAAPSDVNTMLCNFMQFCTIFCAFMPLSTILCTCKHFCVLLCIYIILCTVISAMVQRLFSP